MIVALTAASVYNTAAIAQKLQVTHHVYTLNNLAVLDVGDEIWGWCPVGLIQFGKLSGVSRVWTAVDGLPEGAPTTICCDSQYHVWAGYGAKGLWRFDGSKWDSVELGGSLAEVVVSTMAAEAGGGVWFGGRSASGGFVARFQKQSWKIYETNLGSDDLRVQRLLPGKVGSVWVTGIDRAGSRNGYSLLFEIKDGKIKVHRMEDGLPPTSTLGLPSIAIDQSDRVWLANDKGVSVYSNGKWSFTPNDPASNALRVSPRNIFVSKDSTIWVYGQGIALYKEGKWHSLSQQESPPFDYLIRDLFEDDSSRIVAATDEGLFVLSDSIWKEIQLIEAGRLGINTLEPDSKGGVLIGTDHGIFSLSKNERRTYRDPRSLPFEIGYTRANSSAITDQGFSTIFGDHGIGLYDGESWKTFTMADGLPNDTLNSLALSKDGVLWVAGRGGIASYSDGKWQAHFINDSLASRRDFVSIAVDSQNVVWTASLALVYRGEINGIPWYYPKPELHQYSEGKWKSYTFSVPLKDDWLGVSCLCATPDGTVYAAGDQPLDSLYRPVGGLFAIKNGVMNQFDLEDEGRHAFKDVRDIHCDRLGGVFVAFGNDRGSLSEFKDGSWTQHSSRLGFSKEISAVAADPSNALIVGSRDKVYWIIEGVVEDSMPGERRLPVAEIDDVQATNDRTIIVSPIAITEITQSVSLVDRQTTRYEARSRVERTDDEVIVHFMDLPFESEISCEITNVLGQQEVHSTINKHRASDGCTTVSISGLSSGCYFLLLNDGDRSSVTSFSFFK